MKHNVYQVYRWTCSKTNKSYVGYTGDGILFRWTTHLTAARSGRDVYFYRAIRKYGAKSWIGSVLLETKSKSKAKKMEIYFIDKLHTLAPHGYNTARGGTGGNTWFGPQVKLRKIISSKISSGLNNANSSGLSDENILNEAEFFWMKHKNWLAGKWLTLCKEKGIPRHLRPFRFSEYGGGIIGFKRALLERLKNKGIIVDSIKYNRTLEHNKNTSKSLRGRIWVTDTKTGKSFLASKSYLRKSGIIKGRKSANH